MNYIELFMKHNFISIGERFAIKGCEKYLETEKIFYFDEKYNLRSGCIIHHNSIFLKLLTGVYSVIIE